MLDSDPEDDPVAPPAPPPRPLSPSPSPPRVVLRPLSPVQVEEKKQPPPATDWGGLLTRMKPDAPKAALKRAKQKKDPTPPPAKKADEPGARSKRAWLPRDEWLAQKRKSEKPEEDNGFDIRVHGYWLTRSRGLVYRFPDGREVQATGADAFDT